MDPLSITASTITLIQVAGIVANTLGSFANSMRTADSRLASLCDELGSLTGFLQAIDSTLKGCQKFDLGLVDERLWQQSEIALANCQTTLNELGIVVTKIKSSSRTKGFAWKARVVIDLSIHGDELVLYRDKIHQSNAALQTVLHTINVSLTLRSNAAHSLVLLQLGRLKASIDEALHTSTRPIGGFHHIRSPKASETHVARNLRQLAEAAQTFHTAASSTAGTVRSNSSDIFRYDGASIAPSLMGDFPASRREQVEQFLAGNTFESSDTRSKHVPPSIPSSRSSSPHIRLNERSSTDEVPEKTPSLISDIASGKEDEEEVEVEDEDEDAELEREFLEGLRELANENMKSKDYDKAVKFLHEAISRSAKEGQDYRDIRTQLAFCYFLQRQWRLAEPLVRELSESSTEDDIVTCNLLHALTLGYLNEYSFDDALATCKQALRGKKRLCNNDKAEWQDYSETLALLALIFDVKGDYIRAAVFRRRLPHDFEYSHPSNEAHFIEGRPDLWMNLAGDERRQSIELALRGNGAVINSVTEDVGEPMQALLRQAASMSDARGSTLRIKLSEHEKYELDTAKEFTVNDAPSGYEADDEVLTQDETPAPLELCSSPVVRPFTPAEVSGSPLKKRFTRLFTRSSTGFSLGHSRRTSDVSDMSSVPPSPTKPRWFKRSTTFAKKKMLSQKSSSLTKDEPQADEKPKQEDIFTAMENISSSKEEQPRQFDRGCDRCRAFIEAYKRAKGISPETELDLLPTLRERSSSYDDARVSMQSLDDLYPENIPPPSPLLDPSTPGEDVPVAPVDWPLQSSPMDTQWGEMSDHEYSSGGETFLGELDDTSLPWELPATNPSDLKVEPDFDEDISQAQQRSVLVEPASFSDWVSKFCNNQHSRSSSISSVSSSALSPIRENQLAAPSLRNPGTVSKRTSPNSASRPDLGGDLGEMRLASTFADPEPQSKIPDVLLEILGLMVTNLTMSQDSRDLRELQRRQDTLISLFQDTKKITNEEGLIFDVRTTISWLRKRIQEVEERGSDSGTESAGSRRRFRRAASKVPLSVGEDGNGDFGNVMAWADAVYGRTGLPPVSQVMVA